MDASADKAKRSLLAAETYTPDLLHLFLRDLETCDSSVAVWDRLVQLSCAVDLPNADFITASILPQKQRTMFVRTSYDSHWLNTQNRDPEQSKWSYFRSHALHHLTPILVGMEFVEDYMHLPEKRVTILREAAQRGMRSGFSVPLRGHAPPQAGIITFSGPHARRDMITIAKAHGWTLNVAALSAYQRFSSLYAWEFLDRNEITEKQRELLELIGTGLQDKHIAERLEISISALRQRLRQLMDKTACQSRAEIAALAMCSGLLPDPQLALDPQAQDVRVYMDGLGAQALNSAPHLASGKK